VKTIVIKRFRNDNQNRIKLIQSLIAYNSTIGLKVVKDKIDLMISDSLPFEYSVDDKRIGEFINELDKLNVEYEIK